MSFVIRHSVPAWHFAESRDDPDQAREQDDERMFYRIKGYRPGIKYEIFF